MFDITISTGCVRLSKPSIDTNDVLGHRHQGPSAKRGANFIYMDMVTMNDALRSWRSDRVIVMSGSEISAQSIRY